MSLRGLPDFQQPLQSGQFHIFYPYEGAETFFVTPDRLEIAPRADGQPDFSLEYVRGSNPMLPPVPYGVLDLRLRGHYPTDEALALLRGHRPEGLLAPTIFSAGFLRLRPIGNLDGPDTLSDLAKPMPLAWNGLGVARLNSKLSTGMTTLIKGSLEASVANLYAAAELDLIGVAPRLPLRVQFDPAVLMKVLLTLGDADRRLAFSSIVDFFRADPGVLPLKIEGTFDEARQVEFAEAMADRVRGRWGAFIPSPKADAVSYVVLPSLSDIGTGRFIWDLSEPFQTARVFVFNLDPFEAARQLVQNNGLAAIFRDTTVPSIPTGAHRVSISANLPWERPGVGAVGVILRAPARAPQRPQATIATLELQPPADAGVAVLRLSPAEKLNYFYSTYVVLIQTLGVKQLNGSEVPANQERLGLTAADFPVDFISVEADSALLDTAVVRVIAQWPNPVSTGLSDKPTTSTPTVASVASVAEQAFDLDVARPSAAVALPKGIDGATLNIVAKERAGNGVLTQGPFPAANLYLGLYSFREYGPHTVNITCAFGDAASAGMGASSFAIDLLPEGRPDKPGEITSLRFTRAQPDKLWSWFAASPFHAGYRHRPYRGSDAPPAPWSEIHSPFERLEIQASL